MPSPLACSGLRRPVQEVQANPSSTALPHYNAMHFNAMQCNVHQSNAILLKWKSELQHRWIGGKGGGSKLQSRTLWNLECINHDHPDHHNAVGDDHYGVVDNQNGVADGHNGVGDDHICSNHTNASILKSPHHHHHGYHKEEVIWGAQIWVGKSWGKRGEGRGNIIITKTKFLLRLLIISVIIDCHQASQES